MLVTMERGQVYKLEYLGNSSIKKLGGLISLQKPLLALYALYQKFNGQVRDIDSTLLQTTDEGLYLRFRRKGARNDEEVFYPAPSILVWETVRFSAVATDKKGKKFNFSFQPCDFNHYRNPGSYLFNKLDSKYNFLVPMNHPPLFLCVLNRPRGPKITDLHLWICTSDAEATEMNMVIDHLKAVHASNASKRTGVFDYNPHGNNSLNNNKKPNSNELPSNGHQPNRPLNNPHDRFDLQQAKPAPSNDSRLNYTQSMIDVHSKRDDRDFRPQGGERGHQPKRNSALLPEQPSPWDPKPRQTKDNDSGEESDSEMTQWRYEHTNKGSANVPSPDYSLPRNFNSVENRDNMASLRNAGSRDELDQRPPARLPRITLQTQTNRQNDYDDRVYFNGNDLSPDSVYANRIDITQLQSQDTIERGRKDAFSSGANQFDRVDPVYAKKGDVAVERPANNREITYLKQSDFLQPSQSNATDSPYTKHSDLTSAMPYSGRDPMYVKQSDLIAASQYNSRDPMYAKQSDLIGASQYNLKDPMYVKQNEIVPPSQSNALRDPMYVKQTDLRIKADTRQQSFLKQKDVPSTSPQGNAANPLYPKHSEISSVSRTDVPPQSNDFFFGMTTGKQAPESNISQPQMVQANKNYSGQLDQISSDGRRANQQASSFEADRINRAKQIAAESRLMAQFPDEETSIYGNVDKDLFPVGPALKMLDIGGNMNDRPVARIPPHKTYGVPVLPASSMALKDNESKPLNSKPPTYNSAADIKARGNDHSSPNLRRANTEYISNQKRNQERIAESGIGGGKQDNHKINSDNVERSQSVLAPRASAKYQNSQQQTKNIDIKQDFLDDKQSKTHKKSAEIAAAMGDIEVNNLRSTMKPIGRVNLEESLGYFP